MILSARIKCSRRLLAQKISTNPFVAVAKIEWASRYPHACDPRDTARASSKLWTPLLMPTALQTAGQAGLPTPTSRKSFRGFQLTGGP